MEKIEDMPDSKAGYEEKKIEENVEEKKVDVKKQNKQIQWALILMASLIIIIVAVPYINKNYLNAFDYYGLEFHKTKLGDLTFYSTRFPVVLTGKVVGEYAVNLRNDPRDLNSIPVNVSNNTVDFVIDGKKYGDVFITLNPEMQLCEDTTIALAGLSLFLGDSGLKVKSAFSDEKFAKMKNHTYRWCDTDHFDTVIYVNDGLETSIKEIDPYCYQITFKDCEILQAVEKFELEILQDYSEKFETE